MIDLKASNHKLAVRARRVLRTIVAAAGEASDSQTVDAVATGPRISLPSDVELDELLRVCSGSVKLAALVCLKGVDPLKGKSLLEASSGRLRDVLEQRST